MNVRAIVVDDEPLGRRGVVARLKRRADVEIVAQCASGREAVEAIASHRPDLVFLDVQMPGMDGFAVLQRLPPAPRPHIIFVTAFDQHALRAFEAHALDYLLKPIDDERFNEALDRAVSAIRRETESEVGRRIVRLVGSAPVRDVVAGKWHAERYAVRTKGRVVFVRYSEIDWVEAEGDYVRIHAGKNSWLVRERIKRVERELGPRRFARIHRSTIVSLDRVQELRTFETGDGVVVLRDGTELRVGRSYRAALDRLTTGI
jgi:two-component system LytT family response regulator